MKPKTMWVCVYRDTIEQHQYDWNLTDILVSKEFFKRYFDKFKAEFWEDFDEFLNEYTADDTQDFYDYAVKNNAIIDKINW